MIYAQISNDEIEKLIDRPNWFTEDGLPASDDVLAEHGVLLVIDEPPDYEPRLQSITKKMFKQWLIDIDRSQVRVTYSVDDIPILEAKKMLEDEATDMRWRVLTGGLSLAGGALRVGTTIDDQNRITSVVANAELAGLTDADEVDFKSMSGWVRITIAQIKTIAGAIGQFVQACYSAERAHYKAIALLETRQQINAYDVNLGWPQSEAAET